LDRLGYLGYYREYYNCLLEPDDHEHEPGEDVSGCYNCIFAALERKLSLFELAIWNWYAENVSPFARDHGIVAEMFKDEKLSGIIKRMFLIALNEVYQTFSIIHADMQRRAEA
jgi:hypothetical protein